MLSLSISSVCFSVVDPYFYFLLRSPTRFAGGDPSGGQPFQACQAGHLAHQGGSYNTVVTQALLCCRVVIGAKLKIVACSALGSSEQCTTVRNLKKNVEALHINNLQHGVKTWLKPACCNTINTIKKKFQTSVLHRYISYM